MNKGQGSGGPAPIGWVDAGLPTPGTRPHLARLYHVAVRRYVLHAGFTARQRRRLPWRTP